MKETEQTLAGRDHDDGNQDLPWTLSRRPGNWAIGTLAYGLRKTLRRCTSVVTFDRRSFRRAVDAAPPGALFVLAPSHRSYFDFLLGSYLCFQHPELGIPVPHIAAAEEFSNIPLIGRLLEQSQAFYVRRGVGKEVREVSYKLERLVARDASVMFFVEGQRSRARRALPPRRGLLRALQATGRRFVVLPIAISYDRVPEEGAFEGELGGGARPPMSLTATLEWLTQMARDEVQLGRVHIACGAPLTLEPSTEVQPLAREIVAEQVRQTTVSSFHLRMFLNHAELEGVDEAWLAAALRRRGACVLESDLEAPQLASPVLQQSLKNQWMHWFHGDARVLLGHHVAVRDHLARHRWFDPGTAEDVRDTRLQRVVEALFEPIALDYALVTHQMGEPERALEHVSPKALVAAYPAAHLPTVGDVYAALGERGILVEAQPGRYAWGPAAQEIYALRAETRARLRAPGSLRLDDACAMA
ncbi:1-acyl-sn-glycerol-3-phosphate acyltransferase [Polyangium mundeleinium]|uniref:Glycerol-3-phosphate acyltransferase n=1 Tax=Polyangium mundeleinium TaxID=2995306 RepID=A0ABT5F3L6_9BACT|nr:1-acyl-sn-glycerol-3-phosphate acyltransferase [Polyangium mundeleinium]MDC0748678.1 1-acyl-sn-glycerol-3-phosphate acyltransferase [Polyangium mundeleinium]